MEDNLRSLVKSVLEWWEDNQYYCTSDSDGEEYNLYNEEPAFVALAKVIREKEKKRR